MNRIYIKTVKILHVVDYDFLQIYLFENWAWRGARFLVEHVFCTQHTPLSSLLGRLGTAVQWWTSPLHRHAQVALPHSTAGQRYRSTRNMLDFKHLQRPITRKWPSSTDLYLIFISVLISFIYISTAWLFTILFISFFSVCCILLLFLIPILWIWLKVEGKEIVCLFSCW